MPQIGFANSSDRSAGSEWDFVGVTSGADFWVFPQTSEPALPFIGIGAEELDPLDWTGNLTITLTEISGSGVANGGFFSLYTTEGFGDPIAFMASLGGITAADFATVTPGSHEHYNWAFTKTGQYDVTFEIAGTHATDGAKSASATYSFNVVPEPSTYALLGLGLAAIGWARRRR